MVNSEREACCDCVREWRSSLSERIMPSTCSSRRFHCIPDGKPSIAVLVSTIRFCRSPMVHSTVPSRSLTCSLSPSSAEELFWLKLKASASPRRSSPSEAWNSAFLAHPCCCKMLTIPSTVLLTSTRELSVCICLASSAFAFSW